MFCRGDVLTFIQATKLDLDNAVYPSNLSAALYEAGHYEACAEAIFVSWMRQPTGSVSKKLSPRLAKSLVFGVHDGSIKPEYIKTREDEINALKSFCANDDSWQVYDKMIAYKFEKFQDLASESKKRFSRLPILRGYP